MRGRNTNNRRGPNPLTRNYESNGPDVKIRGSAQQVAEKYMTLARDAQSSGDRVMAENYLQHAEHYNRIIAAAQAQQAQNAADDQDDDGEGYDDDFGPVGGDQPQARSDDNAGNNGNGNGGNGGNGNSGNRRNDQQPRDHQPREHQPRQGGEHRQRPPRNDHQQQRPHRVAPPVEDHGSAPQPVIEGTPAEVALEESQTPTSNEAPVRRRRRAAIPTSASSSAPAPVAASPVSGASEQPAAVEGASASPVEEKKVRRPRRVRSAETDGDTSGNTGSDEGDAPKDLLAVQAD